MEHSCGSMLFQYISPQNGCLTAPFSSLREASIKLTSFIQTQTLPCHLDRRALKKIFFFSLDQFFSVFLFLDQFVFVQFSKLITGLTKTDALQLCRKRLILFKCFSDIVNQHLCICHFSNWNLPLYNVELFQNNPTKYKQTKNKPQFHAMFHDFNIVNIYAFIIFPTGIFHIMLNYSETIRQNINKQKIVDNSAEDNTLSDRNYNSTEDNSLDG